jgi:hypothetical protein
VSHDSNGVRLLKAEFDPGLSARVLSRFPMRYADAGNPAEDRPGHVRAASGIAWLPLGFSGVPQRESLAVIQDDAAFIAVVDPDSGQAYAALLPAGPDGIRQFEKERGNKHLKLDVEACVVGTAFGATQLMAFGSGSSDQRERIVLMPCDTDFQSAQRGVHVADASRFYKALREQVAFSGSELNLEGALLREHPHTLVEELWLFQRGNGAPADGRPAINASCVVSMGRLVDFLETDGKGPVPALREVTQYDLGAIDGVPLSFTDAARGPRGSVFFLACAEASPNTIDDGEVRGSVVGVIDQGGTVRMARLLDELGRPSRDKAEGIARDVRHAHRAVLTVDRDDPAIASDLLHVSLEGSWF